MLSCVPLSVLGSICTTKINKQKQWGEKYFENQQRFEEKTTGAQQSVQCQHDPREREKFAHRKKVLVFFVVVLFNATENKRLKTRRKRLSHHCLPIMNFKSTEPIM